MGTETFTPGELEVMQVLWAHGELKPADVQRVFPRPIRNGALRSVLLVLLDKGHVTRRRDGRAYLYSAKTPRRRGLKKIALRLAAAFAGGSTAGLIAQLIQSEKLSDEDIRALRRLVESKARGRRN